MSLSRFFEVIRARWTLLFASIAVCVGLGFLVSRVEPSRYKATALLMVEPHRVDPAAGIPLPAGIFNHMPTEVDIVRSERVGLRVVQLLGLQNSPEWRQRWRGDDESEFASWVAAQLLRGLDVRPMRESNVMEVSYTSSRPREAARVANAFVQGYIEVSAELRKEPARQLEAHFDQAAKDLRTKLEEAQSRLSRFRQEHGLVALDERVDVENSRLTELSTQVVLLQGTAANAAGRERQSHSDDSTLNEVRQDPLVAELQAQLARQEARLTELRSRLGEAHPSVIESASVVADLRSRLQSATRRANSSVTAESRISNERLRVASAALAQQRQKVLQLNSLRDEAHVLEREVANAQRAFDAVLSRSNQALLESGSTRGSSSVLKSAVTPDQVVWPKARMNLLAAFVIGTLLGLLIVFWRESRNKILRIEADVIEDLRQPLLLVLPDTATGSP